MENKNISFKVISIKDKPPSKTQLKKWIKQSGLEPKKFFNTSGLLYRKLKLADKVKSMSPDQCAELLASDGMLIKRPLLISQQAILTGFKEDAYKQL